MIKNRKFKLNIFKKADKGQSMFEVVIALLIISMIIVGVVSVSTTSLSNSVFSRNKNQAGKYSQEAIEWLRSQREQSSSTFATNVATANYCLQTLAWTNTGLCTSSEFIDGSTVFIREVTFSTSIVSTKTIVEASVVTYWNDAKGYHESKSVTNFGDIRER
jgi:Tfp pilus assembly protein PilV